MLAWRRSRLSDSVPLAIGLLAGGTDRPVHLLATHGQATLEVAAQASVRRSVRLDRLEITGLMGARVAPGHRLAGRCVVERALRRVHLVLGVRMSLVEAVTDEAAGHRARGGHQHLAGAAAEDAADEAAHDDAGNSRASMLLG